jgi:amino acid adenylation domain-containing protein
MQTLLVQEFLTNSLKLYPNKTALVSDGLRLTYREINQQVNQLANALRDNGIQRGDRVALFLPNCTDQVIAIFAILKIDAVFVVINQSTKADKLIYILNNCNAKAIITTPLHTSLLIEERKSLSDLSFVVISGEYQSKQKSMVALSDFISGYDETEPKSINIDQDLACLIYTSGSTGDPKGVMTSHANMVFAAQSIISYLKNTPQDIILNALPLSFDYGLYQLIMTFAFGGTLVLEKGFLFPSLILKRIQEERVTGFPGVPTLFSVLFNMDLSAYDLSSLRYMTNTAAALSSWHIEKIQTLFPNVDFYSMYGLTETKRTLYLPPKDMMTKPESVGIPIPGTEAWIEDEEGHRLPPGSAGELVVRGRHVMRGYWNDPKTTAIRFRPGPIPGETLCYTGDLFKMDSDGYFYFISRRDDIIKSRGEKVSPKEVENVLYKLDGIQDAAVIGVPDDLYGEAIKAFVVLRDLNLEQKDIMRHCKKNLEDFMIPKYIEILAELPKTSSGKIKKTGLK